MLLKVWTCYFSQC